MKRSVAVLLFLFACSDDLPPGMAPEPVERERQTAGAEMPLPPESFDAGGLAVDAPAPLPCCEVTFAVAAGVDDGEVSARLQGEGAVFAEPLELTRVEDRWTTTACVPVGYSGSYYIEVGLEVVGSDEPFWVLRTNPNVSAEERNALSVNLLDVMSCEDDFASHSDTAVPEVDAE